MVQTMPESMGRVRLEWLVPFKAELISVSLFSPASFRTPLSFFPCYIFLSFFTASQGSAKLAMSSSSDPTVTSSNERLSVQVQDEVQMPLRSQGQFNPSSNTAQKEVPSSPTGCWRMLMIVDIVSAGCRSDYPLSRPESRA